MHISRISLQNFRNFEDAAFTFEPGMNCIWGPNTAGKTNLLEAIFFAATGRPFRAGRDGELIRFGAQIARVEADAKKQKRELILEAALERIDGSSARKTVKFNRQPIRKLSNLLGEVKIVLFTPNDETIVAGEPSVRRRFLDFAISQLSAGYLHDLQAYQVVREQRNSLLKRPHPASELLPWNAQLVELGSRLLLKRLEFIPQLSAFAEVLHPELSKGERLSLVYQSSFPLPTEKSFQSIQTAFEKALQETASLESQRGMTLVGPHRDDLGISLDAIDARTFGSQGQQKTAVLSLKLGLGKLYTELEGEPPIYLLDDCLSELDIDRQRALHTMIESNAQSIFTFATAPPDFFKEAKSIQLKGAIRAAAV